MKNYVIIDTQNLFFRMIHIHKKNQIEERAGMSLSSMLMSINSLASMINIDHIVFCREGNSWRKQFYEPYKANRQVTRLQMTEEEQADMEFLIEKLDDFMKYVKDNTHCTVLQEYESEADDLIACWVNIHPDDNHFILSSDSDYKQLLSPNTVMFDGVNRVLYQNSPRFNVSKKHGITISEIDDPEYFLFEKCIRGDSSDNIFSAYPRVPKKSNKVRVGIIDAFEDRVTKGYNWNSFMGQTWEDHNGTTHKVLEDYNRNRTLIDLKMQPEDIKQKILKHMIAEISTEVVTNIPFSFAKMCEENKLYRVKENITDFCEILGGKYNGRLKSFISKNNN